MADTKSHTAPGESGAEATANRDRTSSEIRTREPVLFGKYELLARIRVGGMAEVFRACERDAPERLVAIKRILPSFTDEADYIAMFIDEARLSLRLRHPAIVEAIELGQVEDDYYIALEYIEGLDVGALLRRARARAEPLPTAVACRIALGVCTALEYAHGLCDEQGVPLGIVHRDVSPQNLLVSFDGDVKLIDFGIAKSAEQRMRTQAGILKGKHGYLSPEQALGRGVDPRSDLFSLGICLYEMLAARRLFYGSSDFSTLGLVRKAEVPDLRESQPHLPEALIAIVERMLARQREDRFQNATELREALEAFIAESGEQCDRDALGAFVRAAAAEMPEPVADLAGNRDAGTGLLDAFDDVEPVSAVSVLADAPPEVQPPTPLLGHAAPDADFAAVTESELSELQPAEPLAVAATYVRADPTGEDMLAELSVDAPTRLLTYDSPAEQALSAGDPEGTPLFDAAESVIGIAPALRGGAMSIEASSPPSEPLLPEPPAAPPAARAVTLPGIGMEWDDEELSTQLYDPPEPGQDALPGIAGAIPRLPSVPAPSPFPPAPSFPPGAGAYATLPSTIPPAARTSSGYPAAGGGLQPLAQRALAVARLSTPPQLAPTGLAVWVIAGVLALSAVGVPLALWLTRAPARVTLNLTTDPADATVKLDGVPTGGTSPFVLARVEPDVAHQIEVGKPGYRTWSTRLTFAPGQVVGLPHVALEPDPPLRRVATSVSGTASAEVAAEPRASEQIAAVAAQVEPEPAAVPARARAVAERPSAEPAAERAATGAERPSAEPAAAHAVTAASVASQPGPAAGVAPERRTAPVPDVPRARAPRPAPVAAAAPQPEPQAEPAVDHRSVEAEAEAPSAQAEVQSEPQVAPTPAAAGGAPGVLRINSRPWSRIYVDGRMLGNTPHMGITLGPGRHTVTLVNPDFGLQRVLTVQIRPGETVTKIVDLQQQE